MKEVGKIIAAIGSFIGKIIAFVEKDVEKAKALVEKLMPSVLDCETEIIKIMAELKQGDPLLTDLELLLADIVTIKNLL